MKFKIFIDEAWRGPLAWPVVVWLLTCLDNFDNNIFSDSKKLSEKKREQIFNKIMTLEKNWKLIYSFWFADNIEIDNFWISQSINIATKRWILMLFMKYIKKSIKQNIWHNWDKLLYIKKLEKLIYSILQWKENIYTINFKDIIKIFQKINKLFWIIFDWNVDFWLSNDLWFNITTVIKWDNKIPYIGWASIIAKVTRDNYMKKISSQFPVYRFEKHKWYWTKLHRKLIQEHWICNLHRKSFLKKHINYKPKKLI